MLRHCGPPCFHIVYTGPCSYSSSKTSEIIETIQAPDWFPNLLYRALYRIIKLRSARLSSKIIGSHAYDKGNVFVKMMNVGIEFDGPDHLSADHFITNRPNRLTERLQFYPDDCHRPSDVRIRCLLQDTRSPRIRTPYTF